MKTIKKTLISTAILSASGFLTPQVFAQVGTLEEVIVTARHREESLRDVPVAITAFTKNEIERSAISRAEDFIYLTPGVAIIDAAEVGDTQVTIRGINGTRDGEPNFAFILDGILHTNPSAFNREFAGIEQVEILKGPQGAMYGRNAAAGAIIVTTRQPTEEFSGEFKVSVAEDSTNFFSGTISGELVDDKLLGQLHADYSETDGYYKNIWLGKNVVDDYEGTNVDGLLRWTPSEDMTVDFRARWSEVDAAAISYNANFAFEEVSDHEYKFHPNEDPTNEQETTEFSIKLDYDMGWATLTSWMLYSDMEQWFLSDGTSAAFGAFNTHPDCIDTTTEVYESGFGEYGFESVFYIGEVPGFPDSILPPYSPTTCDGFQYQERNQEDISFEIRLASASDQNLRWVVGGYFLELEREVAVALHIDQRQGSTLDPFSPQDSISPTEQLVHDEFDTTVYAAFGQLAWDVTPDIELAFAARYDREEREVSSKVPVGPTTQYLDYDNDPTTLGGAPLNPGLDPNINPDGLQDRDEDFTQFQPKISLSWDLNDDWTVYTSYGVGFKSGGFNNQGSAATTDVFINGHPYVGGEGGGVLIKDDFDEEVNKSFEVGFKSRFWDNRARLEGAIYHTEVDDMQFFEFLVGTFGLLRVVSNIDEVEITGFELGGGFQLTDIWSLNFGYSYIDSEIKKNSSRPITEGNDSPATPEYTANIGTTLAFPLTDGLDITATLDWARTGRTWFHTVQDESVPNVFFSTSNFSPTQRDDYDLVNLRVALDAENWTLAVFGRNITDEDFPEEVIPAPEFGGSFVQPGTQSRWGVEAIYRF